MITHQKTRTLTALATSVGDFIRYWGFRRIHGEIWTIVFLSRSPLSGAEIAKVLQVSKALVSPALQELQEYNLITQVPSGDAKAKRYRANPDIFSVIRRVLIHREKQLLLTVKENFDALAKAKDPNLDGDRVEALGELIRSANLFINGLTKMNSAKALKLLASLASKLG